jgi:hypothetical protein
MISLTFILLLLLAFGMIAIMAVAIGWWLIPVAIILLLFKAVLKAAAKLFKKKDDLVIMDKKFFDANYVKKSDSAT